MTTTREDFADADLTHRWATEHRIPVVTITPEWKYEAALIVPASPEGEPIPDAWNLYNATWPTDAEAAVIGSYIDYLMTDYNDSWAARMRQRALDADASTNTVTFVKTATGWRYTRLTYRDGLFYPLRDQPPYEPTKAGLIALVTNLHVYGTGGVYAPFAAWMTEHPEVWSLDR